MVPKEDSYIGIVSKDTKDDGMDKKDGEKEGYDVNVGDSPPPSYGDAEKSPSGEVSGKIDYIAKYNLSDEQLLFIFHKMGYKGDVNLSDIPQSVEFVLEKLFNLSDDECSEVLRKAAIDSNDDPNIPHDEYVVMQKYCDPEYIVLNEKEKFEDRVVATLFKFHSPYTEIRAVVDPVDDPTIPVETFRSYFLAILWTVIGSGFNEFFVPRLAGVSIDMPAAQLLLYPCGRLWAQYMPCWGFTIFGRRFALNIDVPWTEKEQMFATLLYGITAKGSFYAHYNIVTQAVHYKDRMSYPYQLLLSIALQYFGFGLAGIMRRYAVYPPSALWPQSLSTIALNRALMRSENDKNGISRQKFFYMSTAAIFVYNFFPTSLAEVLYYFNWPTWFSPNNFDLAAVMGSRSGVGFNPIPSLDLNTIHREDPLVRPFYTQVTIYAGSVFAALLVLAVYYGNYMDVQYLPIFSQKLFTNTGEEFDITEVLTDQKLDLAKYRDYSPPFYTAGNLVIYGAFICIYTLLVGYVIISDWKLLYGAYKQWICSLFSLFKPSTWKQAFSYESHLLDEFDDAHAVMMRQYKEVPEWWFFVVLVTSFAIALIVIFSFNTQTPLWLLLIAIGLNFAFLMPLTVLDAKAGTTIGLNLLVQMIVGYAVPGNPYALMTVKAFGYNLDGQADVYVSNLKIGHYTKIPPIAMFRGQMLVVMIQILVNLGVINWQLDNIKDFCEETQAARFTCPGARVYYNASVVWGAFGPKRIFNHIYPIFKWCWLIGALLGLSIGAWKKWANKYYPRAFNPVIFVIGIIKISPPYNLTYMTPSMVVSFISQYYMRRNHLRIWEKYNYVLAGAFSCGLVFSAMVIFFAIQWPEFEINWWGNDVYKNGMDFAHASKKDVKTIGFFGPPPSQYP